MTQIAIMAAPVVTHGDATLVVAVVVKLVAVVPVFPLEGDKLILIWVQVKVVVVVVIMSVVVLAAAVVVVAADVTVMLTGVIMAVVVAYQCRIHIEWEINSRIRSAQRGI